MRTYIWTETNSPVRGEEVRIHVWRIVSNQPHKVGQCDRTPGSWLGAETEARHIIHNEHGIPFARKRDGSEDRYLLSNELAPGLKYSDLGHDRTAIRLFGI